MQADLGGWCAVCWLHAAGMHEREFNALSSSPQSPRNI